MNEADRQEIKLGLEMLKKRWNLNNNWEVIRQLIQTVDKTVLQLAERKARIAAPEDEEKQP